MWLSRVLRFAVLLTGLRTKTHRSRVTHRQWRDPYLRLGKRRLCCRNKSWRRRATVTRVVPGTTSGNVNFLESGGPFGAGTTKAIDCIPRGRTVTAIRRMQGGSLAMQWIGVYCDSQRGRCLFRLCAAAVTAKGVVRIAFYRQLSPPRTRVIKAALMERHICRRRALERRRLAG